MQHYVVYSISDDYIAIPHMASLPVYSIPNMVPVSALHARQNTQNKNTTTIVPIPGNPPKQGTGVQNKVSKTPSIMNANAAEWTPSKTAQSASVEKPMKLNTAVPKPARKKRTKS